MAKFCFIHAVPDAEADPFPTQDLTEERRVHRCWIGLSPPLLRLISARPASLLSKSYSPIGSSPVRPPSTNARSTDEGTRTLTHKAQEPKSCVSTNSTTPVSGCQLTGGGGLVLETSQGELRVDRTVPLPVAVSGHPQGMCERVPGRCAWSRLERSPCPTRIPTPSHAPARRG